MIYKIIGNFTNDNLPALIDKLTLYYNLIYKNDTLYIASCHFSDAESLETSLRLKKILKPRKDFFVTKITEDNLKKEDQFVIDWCKENFVRLEKERYENEQQDKLRMAMKAIDIFEEKMQESLKENDRKEE